MIIIICPKDWNEIPMYFYHNRLCRYSWKYNNKDFPISLSFWGQINECFLSLRRKMLNNNVFDPENGIFLSLVGKLMTLCFPHSLFIHKILIIKYVWYMKICNLTIKRKNLHFRLTVTYTEVVYPARILPNQTAKPVAETQKLAECIYDCRTLLQQILTDGLTVLQNSKPAPSYQQHKAGLSKQ